MKISIESVPTYARMRYPTLGDWFYSHMGSTPRTLFIQTCATDEFGKPLSETEQFLIALHELIEAKLCQTRGVSQAMVDDFDFAYTGDGEPGDAPDAPYAREHRFAMIIEHLMAHELGLINYGRIE